VYGCLNIRTGAWYIGLTRRRFNKRKGEHIKASIVDKKYAFHKALAHQQREGFVWFVLQSRLSVLASAEIEKYYIAAMKTRWGVAGHQGYNMTDGGEIGGGSGGRDPDDVLWYANFSDYLAFLEKFDRPPVRGGKEPGEYKLARWVHDQRTDESHQTSRGEQLEKGCPLKFPWIWDGNAGSTRASILSIAIFIAARKAWPSKSETNRGERNMYERLRRLKNTYRDNTLTPESRRMCDEFLPDDWHVSTQGSSILAEELKPLPPDMCVCVDRVSCELCGCG